MAKDLTSRLSGVISSKAIKVPCRRAALTNIDTLEGPITLDGYVFLTGDRILLTAQTDPIENGIWEVNPIRPWTRPADWNDRRDLTLNTIVTVERSLGGPVQWRISAPDQDPIVPDKDAVTLEIFLDPLISSSPDLQQVTLAGNTTDVGIEVVDGGTIIVREAQGRELILEMTSNPARISVAQGTGPTQPSGIQFLGAAGEYFFDNDTRFSGNVTAQANNIVQGLNGLGTEAVQIFHDDTYASVAATTGDLSLQAAGAEVVRVGAGAGLYFRETSGPGADFTGQGQLFVRDDNPNVLVFRDDFGNEVVLQDPGVTSFNGRDGAVVPLQTDYDAFFLTPAEGDAAYLPISTQLVTTFNGRDGVVVPLQADYDSFFLTPAEGDAAYLPISTTLVNTFNGRSGTVVPLQSDYDSFFLTPAEGDAAYLGITAQAADSAQLGGVAAANYARTDIAEVFASNVDFGGGPRTLALANGPWVGVADNYVSVRGDANNDNVEYHMEVADGANNVRARFFLSDESGEFGLQGSASTGVPNFGVYFGPTRALRIDSGITQLEVGNFTFDINQTVGAAQDNYVLTYNDAAGEIALEPASGGVTSFNSRTGAVVPIQADYDSFFLTPAEGDAAYLAIGGTAVNANQLGGVAAANYARTDIAEVFSSSVTASSFSGSIAASNIDSGVIAVDRLAPVVLSETPLHAFVAYDRFPAGFDYNTLLDSGIFGEGGGATVNGPGVGTFNPILMLRNSSDVRVQVEFPRSPNPIAYRGYDSGSWNAWHYTGWTTVEANADLTLYPRKAEDATITGAYRFNVQANAQSIVRIGEPSVLRGTSQDGRLIMYGEQGGVITAHTIANTGSNWQFIVNNTNNVQWSCGGVWDMQLRSGASLRLYDADDSHDFRIRHDGTNVFVDHPTGTPGELRFEDLTGIRLRNGMPLRLNTADDATTSLSITPASASAGSTVFAATGISQFTNAVQVDQDFIVRRIRPNAPQNELIINAGESHVYQTGQTAERVYLNAEGGVEINSSPDNWDNTGGQAWANRNTAILNDGNGRSQFPGRVTVTDRVRGGNQSATGGTTGFEIQYVNENILNVWGSQRSSGASVMAYGVRPDEAAVGYESSAGNSGFARAAFEVRGGSFAWLSAGTSTTPIGTDIAMTEVATLSFLGGLVINNGGLDVTGSIVVSGNVDGRNVASDGSKLDTIATGAEVNPAVVPQAEAEAGTATTERIWTAQRVAQAIAAQAGGGIGGSIADDQVAVGAATANTIEGSSGLTYNNSQGLRVQATGAQFVDIRTDLQRAYIDAQNGADVWIRNATENFIQCDADAGVTLFFNSNQTRLATTSAGATVFGALLVDGTTNLELVAGSEAIIDVNTATALNIRGMDENDTGLVLEDGMSLVFEDTAQTNGIEIFNDGIGGNSASLRFERVGTFGDVQINMTLFMVDNIVNRARLQDYCVNNNNQGLVPNSNVVLVYSNGNAFELDLENWSTNRTITINGGPPTGQYGQMVVKIRQDGTAARTITWAGGTFVWAGGTQHPQNSTLNGITIYSFETWDGGVTWYASGADYG